jgi:O-antigen ligase
MQSRGSGNYPSSPPDKPSAPPSEPQTELGISRLGLPRFRWSFLLLGLCIFTFAIVTFRVPVGQLGIAVACFGLLVQRDRLRVPFPVWLYSAFLFWAFAGSFASSYSDVVLDQLIESLKLLVILLVVVNAIRTEGQLRFYLLFVIGCFVLYPVKGALINFLIGHHPYGRAGWGYIYENPNDLAVLSMVALVIALGFILSESSRTVVRIGAWISAILFFTVILLTQSRAALLGLVVAIVPGLIPELKSRPRLTVSLAVSAMVVVLLIPASSWERLAGISRVTGISNIEEIDPEGEGSVSLRLQILEVAWKIVNDHPIFGVGLGAYKLANARYAPWMPRGGEVDTHNTYMNLAAEVGVPGLLLWSACFGAVFRYAHRRRRLATPGMLTTHEVWIERALLGFLVAGAFGSYAALTFPYLLLAVLWCSATLLANNSPLTGSTAKATRS